MDNNIALFKGSKIRRTLHQNEWWFAINDIIQVLTDSSDPAQYFKRMKERDSELDNLISKGGYNLYHPLCWKFQHPAENRKYIAGILKVSSDLSNPSPLQKLNHSSVGWQKSDMSECKKLRILN